MKEEEGGRRVVMKNRQRKWKSFAYRIKEMRNNKRVGEVKIGKRGQRRKLKTDEEREERRNGRRERQGVDEIEKETGRGKRKSGEKVNEG